MVKKRTSVLLVVFLGLLLVGGIFIATWKLYWQEYLRGYIDKLTVCNYLDETACQKTVKCEPIYRPAVVGGAVEYAHCQQISDYKKQTLQAAQILCAQTGGEWQSLKSGDYCNCRALDQSKVWLKGLGCQEFR